MKQIRGSTQIKAGTVTNTELANMTQATVKGRASGAGTGAPADLTSTQLRAILELTSGYGSCYGLEINHVTAGAVQNTWYLVSDTDMTDGPLYGMTHDGSGKLTVSSAGTYLINYSVTWEANANNKHIYVAIAIDGTAQDQGQSHQESITNQELINAGNGIFTLAANATVEIAYRTIDTGAPNINIDDVTLSVVRIT